MEIEPTKQLADLYARATWLALFTIIYNLGEGLLSIWLGSPWDRSLSCGT